MPIILYPTVGVASPEPKRAGVSGEIINSSQFSLAWPPFTIRLKCTFPAEMKTELQLAKSSGKAFPLSFGAGWLTAVAATVIIGISVIRALVVSKVLNLSLIHI